MADFIGEKGCGPTHYHGCACHEAERDARIAQLEADNANLRGDLSLAKERTDMLTAQLEISRAALNEADKAVEELSQALQLYCPEFCQTHSLEELDHTDRCRSMRTRIGAYREALKRMGDK